MTNWAATTNAVVDKGFGTVVHGRSIQGAIIHHVAGTGGRDYVANSNSRDSHPTYHIARDGESTGIVHPNRRPSSTANSVDNIAITFEIANESVGGQWPISDKSMEELIQILLDHGRQSGRKGFAKNVRGKDQSEFFIGFHSQYVPSTECPGPYIKARIDWLVGELNRRATGVITPASVPAETPRPPAPVASSSVGPVIRSGADWAYRRPTGDLAKRIVKELKAKKRLPNNYKNDGDPGEVFDKAIQKTLNFSKVFEGAEDGKPERGGSYGVQKYATKFGNYAALGGKEDGRPEGLSWACFAAGLED